MDLKDKKLIYLLDLDSKTSETELSKQLKTSKQVINYRLKRLEKDKIIKCFQTIPNLEALGINVYANIYFKLKMVSKSKEEDIINFLVKNNKIGYVALIGGRFDLSVVLVAKDLNDLEESIEKIIQKFPTELNEYVVSLRIFGEKFHKKYLIKEKITPQAKNILSKDEKHIVLNDLDMKIIKLMSNNSRISIIEISDKLKEPFSTIRVRIKNLERKRAITGYSLLTDLNKIGYINYKLFIKVRKKSKEFNSKFLSFCKNHPNITWFFKTIGDHDYELRIEIENQEKYQQMIKQIRSEIGHSLEELETVIVFDEKKEDYSAVLESL